MLTPTVHSHYTPTQHEAAAAASYRGRPNPTAMNALLSGEFEATAHRVVAEDIIKKWTPNTRHTKQIAVRAFWNFLVAVGTTAQFFPPDGTTPTKTQTQLLKEERALSNFAMLRVMAGQSIDGTEGYVSHVRTWYRTIYQLPFGTGGRLGSPSITSQYLTSMRRFFPIERSHDERRTPVTWPMVKMFIKSAQWRVRAMGDRKWEDAGIAVLVAYAGLFRMGELTSRDATPFRPESELKESDAHFVPSFWTATHVVLRLGATKADQLGTSDRARPRTLPVDPSPLSPGRALQEMLIARLGIRQGEEPRLRPAPLFQNGRGGHLTRDSVLNFMRSALQQAGVPAPTREKIGTHSCRIGGATRLFQLGASPEILKHLGGWASDTYRDYIRIRGLDMLQYTRRMCDDEDSFQQLGQVSKSQKQIADGFRGPQCDFRSL